MRTVLAFAALAVWGVSGGLALAQGDDTDIDGLYWIDEKPGSFDEVVEKIPIVGLIVRQTRPDAQFLLVRTIDGRLAVQIPEKNITFANVRRDGYRLTARMPNPDNRQETLSLRLEIKGPVISGELDRGAITVNWQGRLIQEHERDRRRAAELSAAARQVSALQSERTAALQEADRLRERVLELELDRDRATQEIDALRSQPSRPTERPAPKPAPTIAAKAPPPVSAARFVFLKVPSSEDSPRGLTIVVSAPGFVSVAGEIRALPLPLRSLSLNGQALELSGGNRFDSTINVDNESQQLIFNAVDAAGETHQLSYAVTIRNPH